MISVRHAVTGDSGTVSALLSDARLESSRYRGHLDVDDHPVETLVACIAEDVVGVLTYRDDGSLRIITAVHVHHAARDVGAGDALVEFVMADAVKNGCTHVRSTALPGDRATKNLFERNGLVARAIQVEKRLD